MELDGGLPCCAPFAHTLFRAQIVQHFADGHRGARCFYAAIDFRTEATFTGLRFGFEAEDRVDYRDAVIDRDLLQSVGHGPSKILGVARFALQNHAERQNRVGLFPQRDLAHNDWDLERARHLMDENVGLRREHTQFSHGVIDQPLDVGPVEQTSR